MQSLSKGAPGIALLHIERARADVGSWETAHTWLSAIVAKAVTRGPEAGLYFGAPAAAFALHAAADRPGRYRRALATLDAAVAGIVRDRLDRAHDRIDRGVLPATGEFDLISGLTGLGALLLRRDPNGLLCRDVLTYLVRLANPLRYQGAALPGWWTRLSPNNRVTAEFPHGHGNLGMAHGVTGPLALLSLAARAGVRVDGHDRAMRTMATWLMDWRHLDDGGVWWPQWVVLDDNHQPRSVQEAPRRPSWCYGIPGIARALQLAGLALSDQALLDTAEAAVGACLSQPVHLDQITDTSLCHGYAGVLQTVLRIARDARTLTIADGVVNLIEPLLERTSTDASLLEGQAGVALALHTLRHGAPTSGWDACLLLA
ncbi:lanthionine synthetase C family protein [Micromonospora sp. C51]|uniref:lanthionine synthetase C family protein n=1 Tax=Micromonospora sp. C51 TaxID=2824879 RepID=UPI001B374730|nr:lanthionine synthetase C family protein [Micromonospora sp. C51]MBQ1047814.1 lanthionine synthetase C family protein [Micromonospora sp. C51]